MEIVRFNVFSILNIIKGKNLRSFSALSITFSQRKSQCRHKMLKKANCPQRINLWALAKMEYLWQGTFTYTIKIIVANYSNIKLNFIKNIIPYLL